jgi:glycosyltransferase involved in cell wall biosynthesis
MPRFSIVTPVYDPPAGVLHSMLRSVTAQSFADWELCLVDDCSSQTYVREILEDAARADGRMRVCRRETNGGIVAASMDALEMASGEFVALLDHDDELHPDALQLVAEAIDDEPEADYVYTDEDKIDDAGRRSHAFLKPDWSPERLRTQMYTCHLSVLRRSLVEAVGGFRAEFEGSQDWDLVLRVTERARRIVHVPEVLYHWRMLASSAAAAGPDAKPWAYEAATRAIQAHCDRTGVEATVEHDGEFAGIYHLQPRLRHEAMVSIVIPTGGHVRDVHGELVLLVARCVESIVGRSTYPNYEIVCVIDERTDSRAVEAVRDLAGDRLRVVTCSGPFNFSERINTGVMASEGEHVLLLNDDMEVVTPDWMERMVMYSQVPDIGAVGAKLMFGDGCLQHAGVIFEKIGPGHIYRNFPSDHGGYFNMLRAANNFQAVTGACLMSRRAVFDDVGGLSTLLPLNYNDMDYCLKLRERGLRVVLDPDTFLYHYESSSRPRGVALWETDFLHERHGNGVPDPYYNPGFLRTSLNYVTPITLADGSHLR